MVVIHNNDNNIKTNQNSEFRLNGKKMMQRV